MELKLKNKLDSFVRAREKLKEIIPNYDDLPRQILRKYRTSTAGVPHVVDFYMQVIDLLNRD